ncbi:MAG: hydrolase [Bacilli bacterium]|nr:hydrolase [Bacilli bacterium]
MMTPRAILFDLDDTLIDRPLSVAKYAVFFREFFSNKLASIDLEKLNDILQDVDQCGYRARDDFFIELSKVLPWAIKPEVDELRSHWYATFPSKCNALANQVVQTLEILSSRGIKLGIITNGRTIPQNTKIDAIGVRPYMCSVIVSETVQIKKPDKRIFELALKEMNVAATEAWFVGDNPINDVIGAALAGLTPVWIKGQPWPAGYEEPQFQIESLDELLQLIENYPAVV